ncbi:class I adenylate-forming enzyme family protein [Microvirga zambiensis]|uniref:class I adenylate-forming enzyme family protein n=1 Tax=Microvirga zambiensis TaxID=1402137 RepID=UPI00191E1B41|nr:class I adenylate-forming enzyme family protein [Microvirga zambiensis]
MLVLNSVLDWSLATPTKGALFYRGEWISYSELWTAIEQAAKHLIALGVRPSDRVVIYAANSAEYLVAALGVWRASGIVATAYHSFTQAELHYVDQNANPKLILADRARLPLAKQSMPKATALAIEDLRLFRDTEAVLPPLSGMDPDKPALICYTSGTTSQPKPVTHSHRNLYTGARRSGDIWRLTEDDVAIVVAPLAWLWGLMSTSLNMLVRGGQLIIQERYRTEDTFDALVRHEVTVFIGVTTMFVMLKGYMEALPDRPQLKLRFCISGGEPRNEPAFEAWQRLTGCPVYDSYGSSEILTLVTYDPGTDPVPLKGSAGRLVEGVEIRLVDAAGCIVREGNVGTVLARGMVDMLGYWNEPELTAAAYSDDGWFRMRDLMRIDADGYAFLQGRDSDLIIRGGANISPIEVESALLAHPAVEEVAVVGQPDATYGQEIIAVVKFAEGQELSEDELRHHCSTLISGYKVPQRFLPVRDFPRNENGKILKRSLSQIIQRCEVSSADPDERT